MSRNPSVRDVSSVRKIAYILIQILYIHEEVKGLDSGLAHEVSLPHPLALCLAI